MKEMIIDAKIEEIETLARKLRELREEVNRTHSRITRALPVEIDLPICHIHITHSALRFLSIIRIFLPFSFHSMNLWLTVSLIFRLICLDFSSPGYNFIHVIALCRTERVGNVIGGRRVELGYIWCRFDKYSTFNLTHFSSVIYFSL